MNLYIPNLNQCSDICDVMLLAQQFFLVLRHSLQEI